MQIAGAKPVVPLDLDAGQFPLDDLHRDHAEGHVLIRDNRAGGNIAVVHIQHRDRQPEPLEILRRVSPAPERRRDLGQLFLGKDRAADHMDIMHENTDTRKPLLHFLFRNWWNGRQDRAGRRSGRRLKLFAQGGRRLP